MIFPAIQTASRALPLGVGATSAAEMRRQLALLQAKWPVDATAYAVSFVIETGVAVLDLAQNALVSVRR
jgi:ribonuclease PH